MPQSNYSDINSYMAVPNIKPKIGKHLKDVTKLSSSSWQSSSLRLRPDTVDTDIFNSIVNDNEYNLPDTFDPNDVIIDIGAHVGCFTYACLKRGANKIYSYEAFRNNYKIAESNFDNEIKAGIVKLYNLAVWRSDTCQDMLHCTESDDPMNTGGGNVISGTSKDNQIGTIQFDKIIDSITSKTNDTTNNIDNSTNRIKLVKLDCEGSEFPILFTSKKLSLIDYICGEYHATKLMDSDNIYGRTNFDVSDIVYYLDSQDFSTITIRYHAYSGLFFAKRKGSDNFFKNIKIP